VHPQFTHVPSRRSETEARALQRIRINPGVANRDLFEFFFAEGYVQIGRCVRSRLVPLL